MKVVIIGGSAGSKIAQDIFELTKVQILGFMNNYVPLENRYQLKYKVLGDYLAEENLALLKQKDIAYFVATGDNYMRKTITEELIELTGKYPINAIHPFAILSPSIISLGYGNLIMPLSVINTCSVIGNGTIINTHADIEHDCTIGDYAQIAPGVKLGGYVTVKSLALLGIGCSIRPHITIGEGAIVAEGSSVIKDVDPYTMVAGVPAVYKKDLPHM